MPVMRGTGLTKEADCAWCAAGKYQSGVGLMDEANCTWCVAGKYQTGSGVHMPVWRPLVPGTIRRLYCDLQGAL